MEVILVRYGEIALKGKNRSSFEDRLRQNMLRSVRLIDEECSTKRIAGRIVLYTKNTRKAAYNLKRVFGITSISIAEEIDLDIDKIKENVLRLADKRDFSSFRITCQRLEKTFRPSQEIEKDVGAYIVEKKKKKVNLTKPEAEFFVEIENKAYIFDEKIPCLGGIPTGIEGKIALFVEDDRSILAGLLVMKRGCMPIPFALSKKDIYLLKQHGCDNELILAKDIQEIERIAKQKKCIAIVVGQEIPDIKDLGTDLPVLRPLIGISPEEAMKVLRLG